MLRRLLLVITPPVLLVRTRVEALAGRCRVPGHVRVWYGEEAGGVKDAFGKGGLGRGGTGGELPVAEQSLHGFEVRTEVGSSGALMLMLVVMMGRWGQDRVDEGLEGNRRCLEMKALSCMKSSRPLQKLDLSNGT